MANGFEYNLDKSIAHYLIFCVVTLNNDQVDDLISNQQELKDCDIVWWVNPPKMKSIPTLWHCQVLARNRN